MILKVDHFTNDLKTKLNKSNDVQLISGISKFVSPPLDGHKLDRQLLLAEGERELLEARHKFLMVDQLVQPTRRGNVLRRKQDHSTETAKGKRPHKLTRHTKCWKVVTV